MCMYQARFKQVVNKKRVNKQGVTTFAWRLGGQHHDAATRRADNVLASECRAHFGCASKEGEDIAFV